MIELDQVVSSSGRTGSTTKELQLSCGGVVKHQIIWKNLQTLEDGVPEIKLIRQPFASQLFTSISSKNLFNTSNVKRESSVRRHSGFYEADNLETKSKTLDDSITYANMVCNERHISLTSQPGPGEINLPTTEPKDSSVILKPQMCEVQTQTDFTDEAE